MQVDKNKFYWLSFVWFQAIWFYAVIYTAQAVPLMLLSIVLHFLLSPTRQHDLFNLLTIAPVGCSADYLLTHFGIFTFEQSLLIPEWLILLWLHFAVTLNHGLGWIATFSIPVRSLFGAVFGTLSYYAGAKMGAVVLSPNLILDFFALAVIWAGLLPVYTVIVSLNRVFCDAKFKDNID